ncbi:multiple monosaccharide ABC transporter permease [Amorphoplanes digitatis]|uniref:Xylose transport system permease protein XylH n=1 Tax=Actinoplanes digitatis TaxID=1868 RepID=A0A7W7HX85_9ACTN|nr:multiple monosaccharide ABC transporter permease [Actinoplanes digitatis]MBB4762459.1 putative multiple sugar transport system permease protein [Actinoplanes digitatis]GID92416.1 sugar ABC transporter permease [Actinoplanes digitatis]
MSVAPTNADLAVDETPGAPAGPTGDSPRKFSLNLRQSGIYIAFAIFVLVFTVLTDGDMLAPQNISNIVVQNSYILILAIGMILIIIAGHIDLSVGSVVAVCGAVAADLMVNYHVAWPLALLITLVVGGVIGAWQGYWVAYFGIPAFIVTLAGMLLFRAATFSVLGNRGIGPFPDPVRTMANGFTEGYLGNIGLGVLGGADLLSLLLGLLAVAGIVFSQWRARAGRQQYGQAVDPMPMFIAKMAVPSILVIVVVTQLARYKNLPWVLVLLAFLVMGYSLLTNRAVFGRQIYAVGGNLQAATLSGVKVKSVIFWLFVNMGVLAALAGVIFAGRLNQAGPTAGNTFELDAIAAAFVGGAAVQGGVGKVVGAITGGLLMGVINNGMSLIGAEVQTVMYVKGGVLLLAVALDVWSKRRAGASR